MTLWGFIRVVKSSSVYSVNELIFIKNPSWVTMLPILCLLFIFFLNFIYFLWEVHDHAKACVWRSEKVGCLPPP